jgi:hypothetical protein
MYLLTYLEHYLIVPLPIKIAQYEQSYHAILENCIIHHSRSGRGFCILEIHRMQHGDMSPYSQLDQQYVNGRIGRPACSSGLEQE